MPQDAATTTYCFACHATKVQPGPDLSAMIPGVTCERCHGPGSQHVRAPQEAKMVRSSSVRQCAECHHMPEGSVPNPEVRDPVSVRFQLVGLSASAGYRGSERLTCISCHNPHQDAARIAEPYVAVCLGCHASAAIPDVRCRRISKQDCLPCHIQKSTPLPYLTFTDHRIRVY